MSLPALSTAEEVDMLRGCVWTLARLLQRHVNADADAVKAIAESLNMLTAAISNLHRRVQALELSEAQGRGLH